MLMPNLDGQKHLWKLTSINLIVEILKTSYLIIIFALFPRVFILVADLDKSLFLVRLFYDQETIS